jgi:Holliday junction resolvase RusA-like endonuclease
MTADPFYAGLPSDEEPEEVAGETVEVEMLPVEQWPPRHAELVAEFVVIGDAKPAGSKSAGVVYRTSKETGKREPVKVPKKGGGERILVAVKDSSGAAGKSWRQDVTLAAMAARPDDAPLDGRLAAEFTFVRTWKPADYSKREPGRLRDAVPAAPHKRPDALKLARAVEDAQTTVMYSDDARITEERIRKVFVPPAQGPDRCEIRVWKLPTTVGELRMLGMDRYEPDDGATQESLPV